LTFNPAELTSYILSATSAHQPPDILEILTPRSRYKNLTFNALNLGGVKKNYGGKTTSALETIFILPHQSQLKKNLWEKFLKILLVRLIQLKNKIPHLSDY